MKNNAIIRVGKINRFFPTLILILTSILGMTANDSYKVPDFAFPVSVENNSKELMEKSLEEGDQLMALRYAMNVIVARNQLGNEGTLRKNVELLDSLSSKLQGAYQSLALLIEAEVLRGEYLADTWAYDNRKLPLDEPWPDDPLEWSDVMFIGRILELIEKATLGWSALPDQELSSITILLENCETAEKAGISVADFIAFKAVDLLSPFAQKNAATIIPFHPVATPETIEERCAQKSKELLSQIKDRKNAGSVVKALAVIKGLPLLPDYDKEKSLEEGLDLIKGTEGEGVLLYNIWSQYSPDPKKYFLWAKEWLDKYPKGFGYKGIESMISQICNEKIVAEIPGKVLPNVIIKGKATLSNLNSGYLLVYKLSKDESTNYDDLNQKKFKGGKPIEIVELSAEGEVPFSVEEEFEINPLNPGLYVIIPSKTKTLEKNIFDYKKDFNYSTFRVTEISILTSSNSAEINSGRAYVVDGKTQKPIEGAVVSYYMGDTSKPSGKGVTNKEGWVSMPKGYYRLEAEYGKSLVRGSYGFGYYPGRENTSLHATILTDLSIYRPGDTVQFAVIGWKEGEKNDSLLKDMKVNVSLHDANFAQVGDIDLVLNSEGRATGSMEIPKGRLLGTYRLVANYPQHEGEGGGSAYFSVEEYKLPPFRVVIEQEATDNENEVKFAGLATTYSGMPISNAKAVVTVNFFPWRWGLSGSFYSAKYTETLATDEAGKFSLTLPLNNLKGTIFERGRYAVSADVTSNAGEAISSKPVIFYLGNAFDIRPVIPDKIEVKSDMVKLSVPVYDMAGLPVVKQLEYLITNLNNPAIKFEGKFESPSLKAASVALPSGRYCMEFRIEGESDWVKTETTLWRKNESTTPYPTPLWVPESEITYTADNRDVYIEFGGYPDTWLLYVLSDGSKTLETEWIYTGEGMVKKKLNIPEENASLFVSLCGLYELRAKSGQISIVSAKSKEKMEIETISFRKAISAGDKEEWTFKFKDIIGDQEISAGRVNALAVMTDKALNALRDFSWDMNIWKPRIYNRVSLTVSNFGQSVTYRSFSKRIDYWDRNNILPDWNTYHFPLVYSEMLRRDQALYFAAPPMSRKMEANASVTMDLAEESAVDDYDAPVSAGSAEPETQKEEIRTIEMPLAFFMPDLKTDEDGNLTLNFTVPNFNTTWQLQIAGYNEELLNSSLILDAVASKPVMVKSSLPQYVRTGDKAEFTATIFNNTEEEAALGGRIEILNPSNMQKIAEKDFDSRIIPASGHRVVSISFDTPDNLDGILVRAYGFGKNHTDGEEGYIPIFPSSTPVIEAETFFAGSNTQKVSLKVPKIQKKSNVTLKYCDNPLWEVLLALPGIQDSDFGGSLAIVRWLYGVMTSRHIIHENPDVSNGLKAILESEDNTLTESNLQKDAQLKITALEATPWFNDANNETQRIRSLEKYFDAEDIENRVQFKIRELENLQNSDGGFSWCDGMKSSPYITWQVISILGYLHKSGADNEALYTMARKAINFYDKYLEEDFKKYEKIYTESCLNYFYYRNMITAESAGIIKKIETQTLDSIKDKWRHWDPVMKSKAGLLLNNYPQYGTEVKEITASLEEFLSGKVSTLDLAMMLQLFKEVSAGNKAEETALEKLMLKKETEDWGRLFGAPVIINALISVVPQTAYTRQLPEIYIGGEKMELSKTQALTGNFTLNLDAGKISGKTIEIRRQKGVPAWGGLISQFVQPIKEVKSAKVDDLSIEKQVYYKDAKGNVKDVKRFEKGDKVIVSLTLTCRKDMDYVVITDSRASCLQPTATLSGLTLADGLWAYRELRADKTSYFIERMSAGKYVISYECVAERAGDYSLGISQVQCLYSPTEVAHSAGKSINVSPGYE